MPGGGFSPAPRPRRSRLIVVIIVVVILIVAAIGIYAFVSSIPEVQVQNIYVYAPDNVCGLNLNAIGFAGYNSSRSVTTPFEFEMPNYNSSACDIRSASTNTTGFLFSMIQVPLSIPANGTASMNITITSPGSDFNGNLNLVLG